MLTFAAGVHQQRRERALATLDAARLVEQDLSRIAEELGSPGGGSLLTTMYGATVVPPTFHPWASEALKGLAVSDSASLAMRLERQLSNLGALATQVLQARAIIFAAKDELAGLDDAFGEKMNAAPPDGFVTTHEEVGAGAITPTHQQIQAALEQAMGKHDVTERLLDAERIQADLLRFLASGDSRARVLLGEMTTRVSKITERGEPDL